MLLLRNPWGKTTYSGDWHAGDVRWTEELVAQVPYGIDPRYTANLGDGGIFVIPEEYLQT